MALIYPNPDDRRLSREEKARTEGHLSSEARPTRDLGLASQPARNLKGKAVVSIDNGEKIGDIDDLLFDPQALRIAAITVARGALINRETVTILADKVRVWGKDVVLIEHPDEGLGSKPAGLDELVKLSDQLRGRYVVSNDGTRIGQVEDVVVAPDGRVEGYNLSQVFIQGPLAEAKLIPVRATSSLGKDVLIVDQTKI